jgi:hypothetical protein
MNRTVTNDNLYLLLPGKVSHFARIYSEQKHVSPLDALRLFYRSNTYKQLEKEETKYWQYGPVALYEEFITGG